MASFRIVRTDLDCDPQLIVGETLWLGRWAAAAGGLALLHPSVWPLHAGLRWHNGVVWLSSWQDAPVLLNGIAITHAPLAVDDLVQCGFYCLQVERSETAFEHLPALLLPQITLRVERVLQLVEVPVSQRLTLAHRPRLTEAEEQALQQFWQAHLPAQLTALIKAQTLRQTPPHLPPFTPLAMPLATPPRASWLHLLQRVSVIVGLLGVLAALAFPRLFSPGALATVHAQRATFTPLAQHSVQGACLQCHNLRQPVAQHCAACHTTANFQATLSTAHTPLQNACATCHAEHRGAGTELAQVPNATCTACHRLDGSASSVAALATGKTPASRAPHGGAVAYPVKANGLWDWPGVSLAAWQQRALPGLTAEHNLREQFHLLHGSGQPQGRTQCSDCHLNGTTGAAARAGVRATCAQCHAVKDELTTSLPADHAPIACIACHAQHGDARNARASVRSVRAARAELPENH